MCEKNFLLMHLTNFVIMAATQAYPLDLFSLTDEKRLDNQIILKVESPLKATHRKTELTVKVNSSSKQTHR